MPNFTTALYVHDRTNTLSTLSEATTTYITEKFGNVVNRCAEARHHLYTSARQEGLAEVRKAQGFYWGRQHNWVHDPVLGVIVDPTASQFGGANGVILPGDPQFGYYDEVSTDLLPEIGMAHSHQYSNWCTYRRWVTAGANPRETLGEKKFEWRTSRKGDAYLYFQRPVSFGPSTEEQVRSGLVFATKQGDLHVSLILQRRILAGGKVYRPTRVKHLLVTRHGALLESRHGKWAPYRERGFYREPRHFFGCFPEEVQDIIREGAEAFPF